VTERRRDDEEPTDAEDAEGWESLVEEEEEDGPRLGASPELEEAMREAAAAVEGRHADRPSGSPGGDAGPAEADAEEVASLKDRLLRLQADFENLRRRTLREKEEAFRYGHENLVKDLLPTVDNLERAVDHARQGAGGDSEGLLQGVELVLRELHGVFAKHGVAVIEAEGQPFDPSIHEAMAQAPDDSVPANTVVQVFQRGYKLWDHLLRPARVIVSKPSEEGGASGEGPTAES
jgi:molecular chaperone GrpE